MPALDVVLRVRTSEYDERLLEEVERYSQWMDLAEELGGVRERDFLVKLT